MSALIGGLAIGAASTLANNLMSEHNAEKSFNRQKDLMRMQNQMNLANLVSAPSAQIQGLRMAGLNPALVNGAGTQSAPTSSLGNADMAQTIPFDPSSALTMSQMELMDAQRENVQASTAKLNAEVPNLEADTNLKVAEKLFKLAGTDKVKEESQNIKNLNTTYAQENVSLGEFGKGMAEKWQSLPWYNALSPDTKYTIDAIASGEIPLSVGAMNALYKSIETQKNLSEADNKLVRNAFDNALVEAQFNDKAVFDAISQEPSDKRKMLYKNIDHIDNVIKKIKVEIPEIVSKTKNLDEARKMLKAQIKSFTHSDLGYLKAQGYESGDFTPWVEQYAEDRLTQVFGAVEGYAQGRAVGQGLKDAKGLNPSTPESKPLIFKPTANEMDKINGFPIGQSSKPWWK